MVEASILACSDESVGIFAEIDSRIECRIFRANRTPEEYIRKSVEMGLRTMQPGTGHHDSGVCAKRHMRQDELCTSSMRIPLEDMRAYIEIGVDGILTNYPERLKAVLTEIE